MATSHPSVLQREEVLRAQVERIRLRLEQRDGLARMLEVREMVRPRNGGHHRVEVAALVPHDDRPFAGVVVPHVGEKRLLRWAESAPRTPRAHALSRDHCERCPSWKAPVETSLGTPCDSSVEGHSSGVCAARHAESRSSGKRHHMTGAAKSRPKNHLGLPHVRVNSDLPLHYSSGAAVTGNALSSRECPSFRECRSNFRNISLPSARDPR